MVKKHLPLVCVAILIVAGIILYLFRFIHADQIGVRVDDAVYIITGESFAKGTLNRLINYPTAPIQNVYSLGYSILIIAPLYLLFGPNYDLMRFSSLVLGIFNIILVFWYLRDKAKLYERFIVSLFFALNDFVAGSAGMVMGENAFLFFLLLFLILFDKSQDDSKSKLFLVGAIISLCAAFWIRYWACAFVIAGLFYLIIKRKKYFAIMYPIVFGLLVLPLALIVFMNGSADPSQTPFIGLKDLFLNPVRHLSISAVNYWHAIPYTMIPLFGPTLSAKISALGLGWTIEIFNGIVFVLLGLGFFRLGKKGVFITISVLLYYAVVSIAGTQFIDSTVSFNETRYTSVMLPFLYLGFWFGLSYVLDWLLKNRSRTAFFFKVVIVISIVTILLARNVRDVQVGFAHPDLSVGSDWIKSNTSPNDIIMTFDPISRFLYLQRKTLDIGIQENIPDFEKYVTQSGANYLLVAPSLLINEQAGTGIYITPIVNSEGKITAAAQDIVLPAVQNYPQVFRLRYHDEAQKIWIYELNP